MSDNNNSPDAEHMDREARRAARQAERKKKREEARSNRSSARKRQRKRAQKKAEKQAVNRDQSEAQRKAEAALAELAEPIKLPVVDEGNSWRRLKYWFNWQAMLASFVVLVPTLMFAIYQIWFATPRYIAEAKYTVRSVGFSPAPALAQSLLSGVSSAQTEMAEQIMAFTKSAEMLKRLDGRMDFTNKLMGTYEDIDVDWWTRLPADALIEEKVEYYQDYVELEYEERSSILTIRTHAFTPNDSVAMLAEIKDEAQKLVTRISNRLSEVQAEKVREQVRNTRKEYIDLQDQMTTLQDKLKSLDPQGEALAAASRIASLEQSLTIQKTELNRLLATMAPGSSAVRQVQNQIAAINEQIRDERAAITGKKNDTLNKVASDFRKLALEAQLAEQAYAMTLSAAGTAGVEAASDIKVFVEVVPPSLPEEALEPRVVFNIFTFFGFAVIAYMVVIIMVMVAREHID